MQHIKNLMLSITYINHGFKKRLLILTLVLLSWATYSFAVLHSHHLKKTIFPVEYNTIAIAISNVLYHAPLGSAYIEVVNQLETIKPTADAITHIRLNGIKNKDIKEVGDMMSGI